MSRKSRVVSFSLPPKTADKLEALSRSKFQTRSEFLRSLLEVYEDNVSEQHPADKSDLAQIIKSYWDVKSKTSLEVIITGLAIIINPKNEVLIGALRLPDPYVDNLSWVFPGGRMTSLDFTTDLKEKVKAKTGLDITIKTLVSSRTFPDSALSSVQIVTLYFYALASRPESIELSEHYQALKWVKPIEVFKHFTSSTSDEITRFLVTLEKANESQL